VSSAIVPAESLTVSAVSTNVVLLPSSNIQFNGSGSNRAVTLSPAPGRAGTSLISLQVSDGVYDAVTNFVLAVHPLPELTYSSHVGGQVELSFPGYAAAMQIWSATNLTAPVVWSLVTDATLTTNNSTITATVVATNRTRFFRLSTQTGP
jgi:hypothetical protein